ncbi:hypothetical protein [Novosphingobium sp. 9U]|uniref:hypothetical protein n=1 Tax=Novosphingobium sp. 9U TaxID=2653158 RepID=UPI0012F43B05|nr:hypothetical protein [Novosphingobium sp. 9U]VWX49722.1 hypothetical protein NOVOSPHI9U_260002 [Novosphingobium sp. 9U]
MQTAVNAYRSAEEKLQQSQENVDQAVRHLEQARAQQQIDRREYYVALETLDACQGEMEASFAALQESSPSASMWQRDEKVAERMAVLGLRPPAKSSHEDRDYVVTGSDTIDFKSA